MSLPGYKEIVDLVKKGATSEAQEKIMELREASIELQEENFNLREEVRELKAKLEAKESLTFNGEVYYRMDGEDKEGPYCPGCYDSQSKLIRLHPQDSQVWGNESHCKICGKSHKREIS